MANTKKVTKKDLFREVIALATENGRQDLIDFANHEIELLESKAGRTTLTATQKENENIKATILAELERIVTPVTISDLQTQSPALKDFSNQKISALLKQLVDTKQVVKVTDKKKSYFSIAD